MATGHQPALTVYFARHGESEANLKREFSNRGLKHGLTARGRQQAATLAQALRGRQISHIFSSPLLRARQTAEIIAPVVGAPFEIVDALREYDCGVLEGCSDQGSWDRYARVEQEWLGHGRPEARIEGGENFLDIQRRFLPFIARLVEEYQAAPGDLVLIGHGGLYRCMLPLILRNVDVGFARAHALSPTGRVTARLTPDGLICTAWDGADLA